MIKSLNQNVLLADYLSTGSAFFIAPLVILSDSRPSEAVHDSAGGACFLSSLNLNAKENHVMNEEELYYAKMKELCELLESEAAQSIEGLSEIFSGFSGLSDEVEA